MAGSSGKIIFLLSRMSPVIRRCAGAVALRAVDPRDRSSTYRFRVAGRLVEGLAQQLGGQVEWESGNKGTIVCLTLPSTRAKGAPPIRRACYKTQRKAPVRSQTVPRQGGQGKNDIQIPEASNCLFARTGRGRGFLHPAGQDQAHRRFRARQGSGGRNPRTRSFFWRRMSEWPSAAHRNNKGDG
jgi:hypothetical protein